ncbi:acyl-CoA dehydrogenase family protein [Alkalihalobacillus hemicellulosilyticus]|uniref:Butyryl-CoA dehydrogenase n=1 Tax=Halalkalibacter hemicellulosilyticusJCM 9152 TaxID=1236971 RepID=W4QLM8_9BACI|nr:acyl-CoA dehydrogenase family protein [Halalkalibacter hemicellulosilyticus]GAE32543.1 butyryl-CoA dehydrogenase [Halalkalibacter hemicellulosilyticusJCM 9152]
MTKYVAGGSYMLNEVNYQSVMTPEDFQTEQRMIAETTKEFIEGEVIPCDEELEALNYERTVELLQKAGEIGLLGAEVPEEYGGLDVDKISSTLISERLAKGSSFALSLGAHVGIGSLPIVYFGSEAQKEKYLPALVTGEKIAAYCLTEPSSGSDALGAKTTAVLSEDGEYYVINGTKQYITNAAFADVFIVYAKVNGTEFSTFIIERSMEGVTVGPEEKKMGIKGSSTCPLILEDVRVPVENLLWDIGKGHVIAFNILNIGRFKLAAGCLGAAKEAIELSAHYANERTQFGKSISSFPLIQKKLAEMTVNTYVLDSVVYRTAGLMEERLNQVEEQQDVGTTSAKAIAEYAIECSINKVLGSETLDHIADEAVQIHGGYGFIQEYKVERIYRDSRINRIFEGTNEINRLLIPGTLLKRAMKGELPLMEKAQALQKELLSFVPARTFSGALDEERHLIDRAKKIFLMVGGVAVQKYQLQIEKEQELLSHLADMMIAIYGSESAYARTMKMMDAKGEEKASHAMTMTKVAVHDAFTKVEMLAKEMLIAMEEGDLLRTNLSLLKKLSRRSPVNTITLKRQIAEKVVTAEKFIV